MALVGCGDDTSGVDSGGTSAPDPIPAGTCSDYAAECPADDLDEAMCIADCASGPTPDYDDCGFWACAVEVGLCDNEVSGDPEILECMQGHGWLDVVDFGDAGTDSETTGDASTNGDAGTDAEMAVVFRVTSSAPSEGSQVPVGEMITAVFNLPVDATSLSPSTFVVERGFGPVSGEIVFDLETMRVQFVPDQPLVRGAAYNVTLGAEVRAMDGQVLGEEFRWSFSVEGPSWGEPVVIGSTRPGLRAPMIVANPSGGAAAVWEFTQVNQMDAEGRWGRAEAISLFGSNPLIYVRGDAMVVGGQSGGRMIVTRTAGDGTWHPMEWSGTEFRGGPELCFTRDRIFAIWSDQVEERRFVFSSRFDDTSSGWSEPERLDAGGYMYSSPSAQIGASEEGDVIATWVNDTGAWAATQPAGEEWTSPTPIGQTGINVGLGVDAAGRAIATWLTSDGPSVYEVRVAMYDPASGWEESRSFAPFQERRAARMAMSRSGNAVLVWSDEQGIVARAFSPGDGWGDPMAAIPQLVDSATVWRSLQFSVAISESGHAVVLARAGVQVEGEEATSSIVSSTFDPELGWSAVSRVTDDGTLRYDQAVVVFDGGTANAVWLGPDDVQILSARRE